VTTPDVVSKPKGTSGVLANHGPTWLTGAELAKLKKLVFGVLPFVFCADPAVKRNPHALYYKGLCRNCKQA
jgi:hypothetical protein